ncbi:MAG: GntR family transcriptional regulator [Desulfobacterium sp.]
MKLQGVGIDRSTTVDKVVAALRRAMFEGNISPGEQLPEMTLSKTFLVSRSTIREALRVLTADGLAVHTPNRGVTVHQLSLADIDDIFLTRSVLETQAVHAVENCTESAMESFKNAMKQYADAAESGDPLSAADAHVEFHSIMVGLIGSKRLAETERALMRDLQLIIASIDKKRDDLPSEIKKHHRLTQMFLNRQLDDAIEWINNDLALAKRFVIKQVRGNK